jgi:bacteriorhodopsin
MDGWMDVNMIFGSRHINWMKIAHFIVVVMILMMMPEQIKSIKELFSCPCVCVCKRWCQHLLTTSIHGLIWFSCSSFVRICWISCELFWQKLCSSKFNNFGRKPTILNDLEWISVFNRLL